MRNNNWTWCRGSSRGETRTLNYSFDIKRDKHHPNTDANASWNREAQPSLPVSPTSRLRAPKPLPEARRAGKNTRKKPKGSGGAQDDVLAGQDDGEQGAPRGTHLRPGVLSLGEILAAALSRRAGPDAAATEAMHAEPHGK